WGGVNGPGRDGYLSEIARFSANSPPPFADAGLSAKFAAESAPFHRPKRVSVVSETTGGAMTAATQEVASLPDMKVSIRQLFGFDSDMEVPAYSEADEHVPDIDPDYRFDNAAAPPNPPRLPANSRIHLPGSPRPGKPPHGGAGGAPPQLALRARQPRQPHQPYRSDRQGCHRHPRRPAGDRVPRRH